MTRNDDGTVVRLSVSNWLAILGLLVGQIVTALTAYNALENRVTVNEKVDEWQGDVIAKHEAYIDKLKSSN